MKPIYKTLAWGLILMSGATSCLDLDPMEQMADPNLWESPNDFEQFANQMYGWTYDFGMVYDDYIHSDKRSDILADKTNTNVYADGTNAVPTSDGDYSSAYAHIRRCNILLEKAEEYGGNPADIRQYHGEAYFFRAWSYFALLQKYGDAIIVTHTLDTDDPLLSASRNDRYEVAQLIVSDLQSASKLLKSSTELPQGRVGSEGAQALLSRVALYEGTWQKFRDEAAKGHEMLDVAATAARSVIDSHKFQLFAPSALGDSALKYLFILETAKCNPAGLTKSDNHEYIFSRCHDETLAPIGRNITRECLANVQVVSAKFANLYLCSDGLPIDKSPLFMGTETLRSEWANRDNRMRYTLCRPGDNFWSNAKSRIDWSGSAAEIAAAEKKNYLPNDGVGYFAQKWGTERAVESQKESYDYPIIRYAEVLLNYAEAVYERDGQISDADLDLSLNLVRRRVNQSMPALSNSFVAKNGLDMRTELRRERTVELFNEGFRIDDLKRWHTAVEEMNAPFVGIVWSGEWHSRWANPGKPTDAEGRLIYNNHRSWTEKNYLYPLPTDQQQLNPNLGQNPGWAN